MAVESDKAASMRRQNLIVIVLAVLLAATLAGSIAYQHGAFSPLAQVYFIADDAAALTPGTTVRISGFRVGKISSMELQPDLKVKVTLTIDAEQFPRLRADARADLVREQLKPPMIDLRAGQASGPLSSADPRIGYRRRGTLTEIAEDLRARLAPILDDVNQVSTSIRTRKGDLEAVLANANTITTELAGTAKEMRAMATDMRTRLAAIGGQSQATLAEVNKSVVRIGGLVGEAQKGLDQVTTALPALLQKTGDTLDHVNAIARDARTVSAAAAATVPEALRGVPPLVDDTREIVAGARQAWPLRDFVALPPPATLPIDSLDPAVLREPTPGK